MTNAERTQFIVDKLWGGKCVVEGVVVFILMAFLFAFAFLASWLRTDE